MKVSDVLSSKGSKVVTILPHQTLKEAVDMLAIYNIGGLVVVNQKGEIKGIVTERDLIRYAATANPTFSTKVNAIMTKTIVVGVLQDEVDSVAYTMTEKHFRHLPVVDGGQLVGILTIGDVVKAQRDRFEGELHTLQIQINAE